MDFSSSQLLNCIFIIFSVILFSHQTLALWQGKIIGKYYDENLYGPVPILILDDNKDGLNEIILTGNGLRCISISGPNITERAIDNMTTRLITSFDGNKDGLNEIYAVQEEPQSTGYYNNISLFQPPNYTRISIGNISLYGNRDVSSIGHGDLDLDGSDEIYLITRYYSMYPTQMYQIKLQNGHWTVNLLTELYGLYSLAIGDADNDGREELVSGGFYHQPLYLFSWAGTNFTVEKIDDSRNLRTWSIHIGDGDNDGLNEIYSAYLDNLSYRGNIHSTAAGLMQFKKTEGGWERMKIPLPIDSPIYVYSIHTFDANGDGDNEIYVGAMPSVPYYFDNKKELYRLEINGSEISSELIYTHNRGVNTILGTGLGDVDDDGENEILFYVDGELVKLDKNYCGDNICDPSAEDCNNCPSDCTDENLTQCCVQDDSGRFYLIQNSSIIGGEICCAAQLKKGNCCGDSDCGEYLKCINYSCNVVYPTDELATVLKNATKKDVILITNKKKLQDFFGDNFYGVSWSLMDFQKALDEDGYSNLLVYVDDEGLLDVGLTPCQDCTFEQIDEIIEGIQELTNATYLIILGSHEIIPFGVLEDPTHDDINILTDDIYGDLDHDEILLPELAVGRIPTASDDKTGEMLSKLLSRFTDIHLQHIQKKFHSNRVITAQTWKDFAEYSFGGRENIDEFIESPPAGFWFPEQNLFNNSSLGLIKREHFFGDLIHFSMHGNPDVPQVFYGERKEGFILQKGISNWYISSYDLNYGSLNVSTRVRKNSVFFSTACYGALLNGRDDTMNSTVLYLMKLNASAYIGSTRIAYNGADTADLLARIFYEKYPEDTLGMALKSAKVEYWNRNSNNWPLMFRRGLDVVGGIFNDKLLNILAPDYKVVHAFLLYGDPTW